MPANHTLAALQHRFGERYRWLLLLSVMIGTMASVMSSTIINVAVPDMSRYFGLAQDRMQWVASGFMVAMTVSMLTTPWLLGRYGYRKTYVGAMALLLVGGVGGGLSRNFDLVLLARVAEGLASGVVQPIPAIIILRAFGSNEQGRASGIFGMGVVLAPAIGPSVGGCWLIGLAGAPPSTWWCRFASRPFTWRSAISLQHRLPAMRSPPHRTPDWIGADWPWPRSAPCVCSTAWSRCKVAAPPIRPSCWARPYWLWRCSCAGNGAWATPTAGHTNRPR